ncbi:hypothetical protein T07_6270 [Trichinella nelsoni]|uniref:Uncharacterized protein n=1 Tax=Trichinella nelsoni TaxID=6336 RepID=A0A0V0RI94_9BILA|nr:hypothetical protein T07_6270 [Trichinella nelsoni]
MCLLSGSTSVFIPETLALSIVSSLPTRSFWAATSITSVKLSVPFCKVAVLTASAEIPRLNCCSRFLSVAPLSPANAFGNSQLAFTALLIPPEKLSEPRTLEASNSVIFRPSKSTASSTCMALITFRTSASVWYWIRAARLSWAIRAARNHKSMCSKQVATFDNMVITSCGLTHSETSILPLSPFVALISAY